MAIMIPNSISALDNATNGEKRLFKILKELLPDNYIVWYELRINKKYPDFIILGPDIGIVVLEVKDWQIGSITGADKKIYTLHNKESHTNPLEQSRGYMFDIVNDLKKDNYLIQTDEKFKGRLNFTYGHGVVFTRILKSSFENSLFKDTIDGDSIIFQDELKHIEDNQDSDILTEKIKSMIPVKFNFEPLSDKLVDRIRGNIFKEVRLSSDNESIFKTMNITQEQYAKGLGYGHRVIRGVAGSGKTVVLTCRAKYLAEVHKDWNILVLCFNKALSTYLKELIITEDINNIEINNFHGWISNIFKKNGLKAAYTDKMVNEGLSKLTDDALEKEIKYDAILIDEGQDFEKNWLEFIVKRLRDPEHSHLLMASDGAQNLYNRKYTLKSIGIKATGRTVIMRENYRNTKQILDFAHKFLIDDIEIGEKDEDDNDFIIRPKASLRQGDQVELVDCENFQDEVNKIICKISELKKQGIGYSDICILYPFGKYLNTNYLEIIEKSLEEKDIPCFAISKSTNTKSKFNMNYNSVKLSTIHSAKGLDFKVVFICGINDGMLKYMNYEEAKKLLYVGMTRSRDKLHIAHSEDNDLARNLIKVYNGNILRSTGVKVNREYSEKLTPEDLIAVSRNSTDNYINERINSKQETSVVSKIINSIKDMFK